MTKIPKINLSSAISSYRVNFNRLLDSIGDLALLNTDSTATIVGAINSLDSNQGTRLSLTTSDKTDIVSAINELDAELGTITSGVMGTTASTVGLAIGELDARLDSINNTQLNTAKIFTSGNAQVDGTLTVDNTLTANGNVTIGSDASDTVAFNAVVNTNILPDADNSNNIGADGTRWKNVYTQNLSADSGTILGDLNVIGNLTASTQVIADSAVIQGIIDSNFADSNEIATIANRTIANSKLINNTITVNGVEFALGDNKVIDTTDSGVQTNLIRKVLGADSDTGIHYDSATIDFSLSNIPNSSLTNSSITINGTTYNLGDDSSLIIANSELENSTFSVNGVSGSLGSDITVDITDSAAIQSLLDSNLGDLDVSAINKGPIGPSVGNSTDNLTINAAGLLNLRSAYSVTGGNIRMYHQYNYADSEMFNFYGTGGTSTIMSSFAPMTLQTGTAFDAITLDATGNIYLDADADVLIRKGGTNVVHFDTVTTGTNQMKFLNSGRTDISTPVGEDMKLLSHNLFIDLDAVDDVINLQVNDVTKAQIIPETSSGKTQITTGPFNINGSGSIDIFTTGTGSAIDIDATDGILTIDGNDGIRVATTETNKGIRFYANATQFIAMSFPSASEQKLEAEDNFTIHSDQLTSLEGGSITLDADGIGGYSDKIYLENGGTRRGNIDIGSSINGFSIYTGAAQGTLNTTFENDDMTVQGDITSISDERTKENIETITDGLEIVDTMRGVYYNKIGETERKVGVIAQEVEKVLPEVVKTNDEGMKSVDYGKMIGVLIEAIKDLKHEIDDLKRGL